MARPYLHYDVFTHEPLLGNQLAVFADARTIEPWQMQAIAREMNFSESTFILPAESAGTDARMRIFTPQIEMPMAGHPTIGSTFALAKTGAIKPGAKRFVFGLNVGPTPVDLEWDGERLRFAWMTQALPEFGPELAQRAPFAEALGLQEVDLNRDLPVQRISCGVPYVLVPVKDPETVDRAVADAAAFKRLGTIVPGSGLAILLFAVMKPQSEEQGTTYSRMFAFDLGVGEDPATGSAAGPLGCYLVRHGVVRPEDAQKIVNIQGVLMGRASRLHIAIQGNRERITGVKVGGEAVLVGTGELLV